MPFRGDPMNGAGQSPDMGYLGGMNQGAGGFGPQQRQQAGDRRDIGGGMRGPQLQRQQAGVERGLGGGMKQSIAGGQPDIFAQFNAWQDPNIGGQQPGAIQEGYGGFHGLDTMGQTKMNDFLNTMPVGGQREQAMNQLGYFNSGNPFTPQVPRGYNRGMRAQAQSGGYSAPGIYQHQASQPVATPEGGLDLNSVGGYTGFTTVDQGGSAQYSPFDINARGAQRPRRTRTFGQVMQ